MSSKISSMFFIRRRSVGPAVAPATIEDGENTKIGATVLTMADSVRPLLTSMKLFGLYFKRRTVDADKLRDGKSCRHWNVHMIYSLVVLILLWINVARMFSVFKNILLLYLSASSFVFCIHFLLWSLFVLCIWFSFVLRSQLVFLCSPVFSVFTAHDKFGPLLFFKSIRV